MEDSIESDEKRTQLAGTHLLPGWQEKFRDFISCQDGTDPAHGLAHIERVVRCSIRLAELEKANLWIVIPAAWLHDCVTVPKDSSDRSMASRWSADRACELLREWDYPAAYLDDIHHAIAAHSFSAGIAPVTIEAKVVQDADRLDALGAVGMSRCLMLGGSMKKELYSSQDPLCRSRTPNDSMFVLDHFPAKLFKLAQTMQTSAAREEARRRTEFMESFFVQIERELN
jgi:uncharacterized protein